MDRVFLWNSEGGWPELFPVEPVSDEGPNLRMHTVCASSVGQVTNGAGDIIMRIFFFNTIFVSSHMYSENPEGTGG